MSLDNEDLNALTEDAFAFGQRLPKGDVDALFDCLDAVEQGFYLGVWLVTEVYFKQGVPQERTVAEPYLFLSQSEADARVAELGRQKDGYTRKASQLTTRDRVRAYLTLSADQPALGAPPRPRRI